MTCLYIAIFVCQKRINHLKNEIYCKIITYTSTFLESATKANLNLQVYSLQLRLHPTLLYGFSSLQKMF